MLPFEPGRSSDTSFGTFASTLRKEVTTCPAMALLRPGHTLAPHRAMMLHEALIATFRYTNAERRDAA